MNQLVIDLDSLTAARVQVLHQFLGAYAALHPMNEQLERATRPGPLELDLSACEIGPLPTDPALSHPVFVSAQQARDMDETAGLALSSAVPPVPAQSTAAAAPLPTAPVEQQAGAPATPSASTPLAPSVPMPPAPPAPAGTGSHVLDAAGLPWDERIHSGSKALNADKTWRARRNMTDEQKAAVPRIEAELRAMLAVAGHPGNPAPGQDPALDAKVAATTRLCGVCKAPQFQTPAGDSCVNGHGGADALASTEHLPYAAAPAASAIPLPPVPAPAPTASAPAGGTDASASAVPANAVELTLKVTKLGNMLGEDELQRACASVGLPDSPQAMLHLFAAAEKDPTIVARLDAEIEAILAS